MSNYSTLQEAWGCEAFTQKRKKKRRKKKNREGYQNYEEVSPSQGNQILNAAGQNIYRSNLRKHRQPRNLVQYDTSNPSMNMNRLGGSSRSAEPIKIQYDFNENDDYDGYNSSDYEQYTLEEDNELILDSPEYSCNDNVQSEYIPEEVTQTVTIPKQSVTQQSVSQFDGSLDSDVIRRLYVILDRIESNSGNGENIYDLLLFIFFGFFILFVIDYIYKIGVRTSSNL